MLLPNPLSTGPAASADPRSLHHRNPAAVRLGSGFYAQRFPTMGCESKSLGNDITAAVTSSDHDIARASQLVEQQYVSRGYTYTHVSEMANHPLKQETVMVARQGSVIIGTMTITMDGPHGLWLDHTYPDIVASARSRRRRLCELTRLALCAGAETRATLIALFALAHQVGYEENDVEEVFIEVNPRHKAFYCRSFGFKAVSDIRTCDRVNAPAVLLQLDVAQLNMRLQGAEAVCG